MERGSVAASTAPADLTGPPAAAHGALQPVREPPIGIFGRAVRGLDRLLRRHMRIYEFSRHPGCLLRVAIVQAGESVILSDGTRIAPHDRLADLHLWNERAPPVPEAGPNLAWAVRAQRRLEASLVELARHLAARPELHDVRAIRADAAFVTRAGHDRITHLAGLFGFERPADAATRLPLVKRIHDFFADFLVLALVWTFNRRALQRFGTRVGRPRRERLWMSRETLLRRYGPDAKRRRPHWPGAPTTRIVVERKSSGARSVRA